ncbi:MAG: VOC family protein [Shimia sp.]
MAQLEHLNITVPDGARAAAWLGDVFGWHIRWQGRSGDGAGQSFHVGSAESYIALYQHDDQQEAPTRPNHIGVVVDDLTATRDAVEAAGFTIHFTADYEPGQRFYFFDHDGIEWEVVHYPA